jgi:hypothetical protein
MPGSFDEICPSTVALGPAVAKKGADREIAR